MNIGNQAPVEGDAADRPFRAPAVKAEWRGIIERRKAWDFLKESVRYGGPPDGVTLPATSSHSHGT